MKKLSLWGWGEGWGCRLQKATRMGGLGSGVGLRIVHGLGWIWKALWGLYLGLVGKCAWSISYRVKISTLWSRLPTMRILNTWCSSTIDCVAHPTSRLDSGYFSSRWPLLHPPVSVPTRPNRSGSGSWTHWILCRSSLWKVLHFRRRPPRLIRIFCLGWIKGSLRLPSWNCFPRII